MSFKRTYSNSNNASFKRTRTMGGGSNIHMRPMSSSANVASTRNIINRAPKKAVRGLTAVQKAAIKAMINNSKEQKMFVVRPSSTPVDLLATADVIPPTFFPIVPPINEGTANYMRIGEQVTITKSILKINLNCNQEASSTYGPFLVQLFIGKPKNSSAAVNTTNWTNLLMGANGVATGFYSATAGNVLLPTDDGTWDIKLRKTYKLGKADVQNAGNNDFSLSFQDEIDVTKWIPKKIEYVVGSAVPVAPQLWYFVVYTNIHGGSLYAGTPQLMSSVVTRYTDA